MPLTDIDGQRLGDSVADKLGVRNLIINGAMQVSQRTTSTTGVTTSDYRACDRWRLNVGSLATWTIEQSTDAPNGFSNSFKATCTTADASPASSDALQFYHRVEAQDLQHLAFGTSDAKAFTVSFYIKSNKTGSASLSMYQHDNSNKQFSTSYTVNSANTWEYKTITIPGDTAGLFNNDNGFGLALEWWLNSGSNFTGGSHSTSWTTFDNTNRNASNFGLGGAVNDYFQITGVQLEVGNTATPFEHRSFADELARCQRYFQKSYNYSVAPGTATTVGMLRHRKNANTSGITDFKVRLHPLMRANPTVLIYSTSDGASGNLRNETDSANVSASGDSIGENGFTVTSTALGGGKELRLQYTAEAEL